MAEHNTQHIKSVVETCHRELEQSSERSGERFQRDGMATDPGSPSERDQRGTEEDELDGFPVIAADEEDCDLDSSSSVKGRHSDEPEENDGRGERVSLRGADAGENAQHPQMGEVYSQTQVDSFLEDPGGGHETEALYSPLMKIKDEPIDEGYDKALTAPSHPARIKQELENGDPEAMAPPDELKISSVFSVRGDDTISASAAASQPPPYSAVGQSAPAIKVPPMIPPIQAHPHLQPKPLGQPQAQLLPLPLTQPQLQPLPLPQSLLQAQLQPQPPPASVRICCSGCSKVLQKGQTAFQRKGSNQLFCSTVCLTGFNLPPTLNIAQKKTCHLCLKIIGNPKDLITVPVDASNTLKEFCSQACLNIFKSRGEGFADDATVQCSICRNPNEILHEVTHQGFLHRLCSDDCFSRFRSSKRLSMSCCESCGSCTATGNYHLVQIEDAVQKFCSPICITTFKQKSGKNVHCPYCNEFKAVDQMLEGTNTQGVVEFFCSSRCLTNSQASRTLSGASFPCTNCQKLAVPQYHLAMPDGSIRNFCSYECVGRFQEKLNHPTPTTHMNGGSTAAPFPAANMAPRGPPYPSTGPLPPPSQVHHPSMSYTGTPSQNPPLSSQPPLVPYGPASGLADPQDNQRQHPDPTAYGTIKLTCKQCQSQFSSKPEVLQFKNHTGLFCSRMCCDTYKREKDIKAVCEYCRHEKVVKDVAVYEHRARPFCCEGCKLLFKHDLAKRHGGQCRVCAYCCNMTHSVVQNHFGGRLEEFCTEECMSLYTVLFYEMAKCHDCKTQGVLKESLRWDETILYFCNLHCVVQFCSKSVSLDQPHSNGITSATEAQTPLSISKDMPVIGGVVSLASALAGNTALTGALPTSNCSSKIIGDASTQTDVASHAVTRHRRTLKNKALMCKPIVAERAIQCELQPPKLLHETMTDENGEKVRLVPVPVPVPVPVYIPLPMHLYTQYTPVPVGLPLPLPVPMVAPAFGDPKGTVASQSSVDDEDVEKGKGRSVSHGDLGSTYSGDLESEARSTPFSWADTEDTTHGLKPLIPSSVMEGAPSMVDLEKDFPLASNDHGATKEQKPAGKRRRRGKREDADDQVEELDTDDGSQPIWDTDSEQLNVETCQRETNMMKNVSSKLKSIPTDEAQIEPHATSKSSQQLTLSSHSVSNLKPLGKTVGNRTLRTKRNFCVYCKKPNTKIGRHLQQKHATEADVAHALSFPKGSKKRHLLFEQLCKKGNYQHNIEVLKNGNGEIVTKKRTKKNISSMEYLPCQYCLAFYLRHALLKHENSCKAKITSQALQEQTFRSLDTLSPVGPPNPTSSPESRLQPNPVSSQTSTEFFLPSLDLSQSCCRDTEKYSPEISPASEYCYQSSLGTNPAPSPQPSDLSFESYLPSSVRYPDHRHSPSLNLCHQSSFRSSPEPGSQSDFEPCFQATERSRHENSSSPSPKFSYQTSLRISTEPSPQISQTTSESCLPSTLKSSLEVHSPPNPDSSSSPQPTLDSCLQSDMRSSAESSLPSLESCLKSSMKSRPNHFLQSSAESSTKPTESDHQPSLSCRSSPQSSLTSRPKYSLRSTSRVSRTNFNTDNSGNHEYELDSDASSGSAYDPTDDENSDCSINSDDSLDRPVAKNLIADVDVNSTFTLSSCQDNSLQAEMGSAREMKKTFGSSTGFSPQYSENSSLIPSSSSGSVVPKQLSVITCNKTVGGQKWNKRQFCVYCKKPNTKIARHLIHRHANETDVAHALSFRKGSKRRLLLLDQLRKKGNYLHNIEVLQNGSGELVTYKRPTVDYSVSEYLPCQHCLAFYVRHDLWRHEKACKMRKDSGTGCRRRIQSASSKMLPVHGFRSGACEEIIHGMNQDSVLDHIREDDLICKYGDTLMVKLGQDKKHHAYISQKLRELGRFMLAVKEFDQTVQHLHQICTPSRFELAIKSAKKISGFDESSNKVETPSLVLKIGYSLRQTAEILFGESFMGHDSETAAKAKEFIELLETNWISCVRNSDLDIPERNDFDMVLENPSELLTACQQSETDNIESALLPEIGATSQYSEKTPDLPPDLTLSIQPIPESNLEDSQNLMSQLLFCSSPNVNGQNMDNKECELNRSSLNEFHPTKNGSLNTEPSTGPAAAPRKKLAKNIRINSKFSTLSCLRAKPRCKASSSKSKFSSVKSRVVQSCKTFGVRRIYGKKQSCLYCKRLVSKIARHLEKKHAKEKDVAHALSFPKGSNTRKLLLKQLRNKGNYEHNIEIIQNGNGEIIPLKRPKKNNSLNDYEPCPHCLGFYVGRVLWQHQRSCKMKKNGENPPRKRRFRLTTFSLHESLSEGCQDIVRRMRDDNISKHLRNDSLICKFGNRLYEKVGHQNAQHNYISQKMRELGRFMLAVKELDRSVEYLHQVCSESKFNLALESAKVIGGFDKNSNKFKTPVIALKLGYSLKRATEIALAENSMREDAADQARRFIELLETDWITFVSSHTCTSGNSSKQNTVDVEPLTEDVIKLQKFLRVAEDEATSELIGKPNPDAWKRLRESVLAGITLFNRRRKGVADKMLLENYINRAKESFSGARTDTLTKLERSLSDELIRIEISCGDGSTITVLLTKQMASSLDLLIKCRKDVDVPVDNPFIFARLGASTHIRATDCLRNLVQNCGAGNPEGLTSGYTHKHVAILYQILSLNGYEKQHVAKLVGDDSYDYQGLNENSSQLAKICSLLHTMDQGTIPCRKDHGPREVTTAAEGSGCIARSKEKRKKWGEQEQQAVRKQMGKYISLRKVPGKKECLDCIKNEPDALKSRTWKDIKNYIHNTIQSNKRRMAAKQMEEDCSESDGEDRAESDGEDRAEGVAAEASVDGLVEDGGCSKRRHLRRGRRRLVTDLVSSVGSSPSSSKLHHMYGVNAWTSWVQWRGQQADASPLTVKEDVLRCSSEELSDGLCRFICEVLRPNGQAYAPDSVYYLCLGIQQHLLENGRLENIFVDPLYSQFTADITALLKNWEHTLPPSGLLQSRVEESFLWECKQLGALSPFVLLNTLLFFGVKLLGLKTLVQHRSLSFSNVGRCSRTAEDGRCSYLRFRFTTKEEGSEKQIVFGKRKREKEDNEGYLPENTENPLHCPVRLYEFYLSKCSDSVKRRPDLFYLQPLTSCHPDSPLWFSDQALDPDVLESMLVRVLAVRHSHLEPRAEQRPPASSDEESS